MTIRSVVGLTHFSLEKHNQFRTRMENLEFKRTREKTIGPLDGASVFRWSNSILNCLKKADSDNEMNLDDNTRRIAHCSCV